MKYFNILNFINLSPRDFDVALLANGITYGGVCQALGRPEKAPQGRHFGAFSNVQ